MDETYDLVIKNGRFFDGSTAASAIRHLGIRDGLVCSISPEPLDEQGAQVIDAHEKWVMPGFVDIHTHYDAELLVAPGLEESVRHGVTTVLTGSCSLSTVFSDPLDCADLYARVEALPYKPTLGILERNMDWHDAKGWTEALDSRALGPNIACLLGHSDLRAHVMGLGRSTSGQRPTKEERKRMVQLLEDALDAGFVGLSTMTNPWDKLDGDRYRSRALPSTYATWREYGWLHRVLRRRGRVLQSAPNLNTKVNMLGFFLASAGSWFRKTLKTTLISAADPKASPWLTPIFGPMTRFLNWVLRADLRWQTVPCPFEMYADGIDLVVFEEFGAGAAAMHLAEEVERNELLQSEAYRRRFRKDYEKKFSPRIWHRDFHDAHIVACPEAEWVGLTVGDVADQRGIHPCDAFLDLVVAHGSKFRWKTVIANHRASVLRKLLTLPCVQVGFSDSGAHLRNMAFYNFPLHMLRMALETEKDDEAFLSVEHVVYRLTSELAEWFELDAGKLETGARADIAIIDPQGLDQALDDYHEAPIEEMEVSRLVRRNDAAVLATVIAGRVAYENGKFADDFGTTRYGRYLPAGSLARHPLGASQQSALPLAKTA